MTVCERVKKYIDDNEIKQVTVARKAGMPIATFNAMINGKRKMYADDLQRICCALNVGADTFIRM